MIEIRPMTPVDWPQVRDIYEEGIASGDASFETAPPDWVEWNDDHLEECRLVAEDGDGIVAWAALSPVSGRCVYGGVAEVSVYVASASAGRGVGSALMQALVAASEQAGLWTLQAGIFPENAASLALHRKHGFRDVGVRHRLGRHDDGRWRDVVLLERRSQTVGL